MKIVVQFQAELELPRRSLQKRKVVESLFSLQETISLFAEPELQSSASNDLFKKCDDGIVTHNVATHETTGNTDHEAYNDAKTPQTPRANYSEKNWSNPKPCVAIFTATNSDPTHHCCLKHEQKKNFYSKHYIACPRLRKDALVWLCEEISRESLVLTAHGEGKPQQDQSTAEDSGPSTNRRNQRSGKWKQWYKNSLHSALSKLRKTIIWKRKAGKRKKDIAQQVSWYLVQLHWTVLTTLVYSHISILVYRMVYVEPNCIKNSQPPSCSSLLQDSYKPFLF